MYNYIVMKKIFAFIILLCFAAVSFSAAVFALRECNCGCICGEFCCCEDICDCGTACECPEDLCFACEAIIKQRASQQQVNITSNSVISVCPITAITAVNSDILGICTANIIEHSVRMNN
jgi:hypothetical protein